MFQTVLLSIIRSFSLYTQQWYMSYRLCWLLASRNGTDFRPDPVHKLYDIYHCNGICHTVMLTACKQEQDRVLSWSCSQAVWHIPLQWYVIYVIQVMPTACEQEQDRVPSWSCSQAVWHIPLLCVQWKTPDDGQRNCPKHAEFCSKNKFEKLVHLVGFIIRSYHDARSPECQKARVHVVFLDCIGRGEKFSCTGFEIKETTSFIYNFGRKIYLFLFF